ncbi:hypothetical protein [Kitasatospora sp. GP82]|uniref:hypothetical protein n=1 Tax=Kitasatospora sp. GP82 TaxID=3035089 RepID=UPI0024767830|nr:hypothetical protein [Kitasatospora sp. GP82]MDH6128516.1 putative phage infection (PIP) family protein YhgE [Kitasatospora sp. GP82]
MGDFFRVEIGDLDRLLQQLQQSQQELHTALNAMRDTGPKTTGSKALDHACDDFQHGWGDEIKMLAEGTEQISTGLNEVRKNYAESEQGINDALRPRSAA